MINIIKGDATEPIKTPALIAHVCNDIGKWGSGFVVPLGEKYPRARMHYLEMKERKLGSVWVVQAKKEIFVANMIAQHDIKIINRVPPIRYNALADCLAKVFNFALKNELSLHMPKIGSGRAGGDWSKILELIQEYDRFTDSKVDVTIYEYSGDNK